MATYATLDPADQLRIDNLMLLVRPLQAEILRLAQKCEVAVSDWNSGASALVATLDAGDEIPNKTGLSGAREVTKENLANNLMAYVTTVSGLGTSGHIGNMLSAAGAVNIIKAS